MMEFLYLLNSEILLNHLFLILVSILFLYKIVPLLNFNFNIANLFIFFFEKLFKKIFAIIF